MTMRDDFYEVERSDNLYSRRSPPTSSMRSPYTHDSDTNGLRIMDHSRLDFIGSRTHTNVLKGKEVRQQDDGADNFADYCPIIDSNEEVTSSTDHDYFPKSPKVSEIKLNPSTQNVRTIQSSNILHSEAKDNDKPTKISTKPVKNEVSDYHENIHSGQTKKQDLFSKPQEDEHQNSTISVNVLHSEAEDKNKQNNTEILTSSLKSSKNCNTNSLRDSVTKETSPLFPKISLPSESGCHNISTSSLSPISEQSKERKNIFVFDENPSQALVDTSPIHTLSPAVKLIYINPTNVTQSESLSDESPNEKNNNRKVSTIFKNGSKNHSMLKYRNSSQITRHDDYDAEIREVMHVNEKSLERLAEEQSSILSSPKPSEKNKAVLNNSAIMNSESNAECDETTAVVQKKKDGIIINHGESECVSSNKILSRSRQKNNVSRNNKELFEKRSVSQNFYNEKEKTHKKVKASEAFSDKYTENSNVPAKERNSIQNLHIQMEIPENKIYEKLKTSRNLSKDNEIINAEINKTSSFNFHSEKKNIKAKNKEKQKASETIEESQNSDNYLEEDETETTFIHKERKEQASESHQDISLKENNNQQVCSPPKKIKKKHSTDVNVPLRRSIRRKFPPLERWHNERLLYRFINGISDVHETIFIHKKRKEQASESHQDISLEENNNQQVCSPPKKIKKKNSTDVNVPLRRSVRRKFPLLERWRNERLLYRFINGIPDVHGIDPGVNISLRKREKIKKKVKKRPVLDAINGQTIRDRIDDEDPLDEEHPYRIKRIFRKTWKSW